MEHRPYHHHLSYFTSSFGVVLGLVLIWRGTWYLLDYIDQTLFNGQHAISVIGSIIIGFMILYLPDRNLDEIRKL